MSPVYDFQCNDCRKVYEVKMTMSEHASTKDNLTCQECNAKLSQVVAPLRFDLKGSGWFGKDGSGTGYEITQREMDRNVTNEAKFEDYANQQMVKDKYK